MEVIKYGKRLRCGYTTGSCAAAASKAAVLKLLGKDVDTVDIKTPEGTVLNIKIVESFREKDFAICCVAKDAGDEIDVTDGIKICSRVSFRSDKEIVIDGGEGIGRFVFDTPFGKKGEAAINKVPKQMIEYSIREVYRGRVNVLIFAPEGKEIAKKTFNPRIGIEGGISIIGTKGIVSPMSEDAYKKTIFMEMDMIRNKTDKVILTFGNYGESFVKKIGLYGEIVKVSNFIGEALLYCKEVGFKEIVLVGHIGKICKISIGAFNTHSKVVDSRVEAFVYYLAKAKAPYEIIEKVETFKTAEECASFLIEVGYGHIIENMRKGVVERIMHYLKDDKIKVDVYVFTFKMLEGL
jgi:cobalt-precorrin-5B (C1)-methyltransferase